MVRLGTRRAYLTSLPGLNDTVGTGSGHEEKSVRQKSRPEYKRMSRLDICEDLRARASAVQPSFVEICKKIAKRLHIKQVGVGKSKSFPL